MLAHTAGFKGRWLLYNKQAICLLEYNEMIPNLYKNQNYVVL